MKERINRYTIALLSVMMICMLAVPAMATTVNISADKDTWVMDEDPDTNAGVYEPECLVVEYCPGAECFDWGNARTLISFDLSSIPPGATINSATVHMAIVGGTEIYWTGTYNIHRLMDDWDESAVTWNTQPPYDPVLTGSTVISDTNPTDWVEWDVTSDVGDFVGGTSNYGWLLKLDPESDPNWPGIWCDSSETTTGLPPYLEVTYTPLLPSVETATGSGTTTFESDAGVIEDLAAIAESAMPDGGPNLLFPHGFFSFNITGLTYGATANVTITLPYNVPVGTEYWKYHSGWVNITDLMGDDDGDNVVTIRLTDGGIGDADGAANGIIIDPGSVGVKNTVYLVPKVSGVSGGAGTEFTVDVRVNATETINSWQTDIAFDYSCIDVTNVTYGWSGYNGLWTWGPGQITMGDAKVGCVSGDILLATLTIQCTDCCASSLDFTGTRFLKCGAETRSASWENGSVICGTPVGVVKTVLDPATMEWVDTMDVQDLDTNVTFNCTVDATCCNLTDLIVTDEMDDGLMYSGGATVNGVPCPPDAVMDAGRTLVWNSLSDLDAGETLTIKFNATTEAYGVPCNVMTLTGLCDGIPISADDDACIRMGMPKIAVDPIDTIIQPQEQFDINITVDPSGACEVYGVEYDLHYDPTVLRAESLVKGPFLGEISETMVSYIDIDEVNGIVSYAETRKDPPCPGGVTDPGVVTRIHFTAIGARGATTTLNLTTVIIVDNATMEAFEPVDTINGTVSINDNVPPVPIPQLKHRINNVAQKYQSTAILCSCSYDPDGFITYLRWAFGDGQSGTSEGLHEDNCTCKEHDYESHQWEPYGAPTGHYVPYSATLTVTDNGCPEESNSTSMNVTVYVAGDANGDGKVNVLDAVWVGKHWRETCCTSPPCDPCGNCTDYLWVDEQADGADLNNDCKINVLDAVVIGANWRHVAW